MLRWAAAAAGGGAHSISPMPHHLTAHSGPFLPRCAAAAGCFVRCRAVCSRQSCALFYSSRARAISGCNFFLIPANFERWYRSPLCLIYRRPRRSPAPAFPLPVLLQASREKRGEVPRHVPRAWRRVRALTLPVNCRSVHSQHLKNHARTSVMKLQLKQHARVWCKRLAAS